MKMDTMNISLTRAQSEYVRRSVERDFGNASEFFRDLLRERMRREIGADLDQLQATDDDAPAGPSAAEIGQVLATQRRVRKERSVRVVLDANVVVAGACWQGEGFLCLLKLARRQAFAG
ncbi:MAG: hypothetical protein J0L84_19100, partial [Verrucomicrobia bacterium]|nr:hypothetical protein [Verrucomicrobiota bacterium]